MLRYVVDILLWSIVDGLLWSIVDRLLWSIVDRLLWSIVDRLLWSMVFCVFHLCCIDVSFAESCIYFRRGLIMGIWNSHTSVGNILGSLIAGAFVNSAWGWSFVVPGIIIGTFGLITFFFLVTG